MGKKQKAKNANKAYNEQCPNGKCICPHLLKNDDIPTQFAGLGVRSIFAIMGWFALGLNMEGNAVFNSIFLYFAPLLLDYLRFKPRDKKRSILKYWELGFCFIFICISALGFFGIIEAVSFDNITRIVSSKNFIGLKFLNLSFPWIWRIIGIAPITTVIDYFAYKTPAEEMLVDKGCAA